MKRFIFLVICANLYLMGNEQECYRISNQNVVLEMNEKEKKVIIHKLSLSTTLFGEFNYSLNVPYMLPIVSVDNSRKNIKEIFFSDYFESTGIKSTLKIYKRDKQKASLVIDIQHEEVGFFYNPQLMVVEKIYCIEN